MSSCSIPMVYSRLMKTRPALLFCFVLWCLHDAIPQAHAPAPQDYSGMYSFLKEGEFVQITIEDKGAVSGFISRYGDSEGDKGVFLDQFFKSGKIDGDKVDFTTERVHGVWYTFEGRFERGPGKRPGDER